MSGGRRVAGPEEHTARRAALSDGVRGRAPKSAPWRLVLDPPAGAAHNMAVDEALYISARRAGVATVRLYSFASPTVSVGYRQRLADAVDAIACEAHGVGLVRRITGGFALLHQHELTWSVAAPARVGPFRGRSVRETYRAVNAVIRRACESLGVGLDPETPEREETARVTAPRDHVPPCLAARSLHEITVGGRKLVPSAQRRHRESFLQHGSVLYAVDEGLWDRIRPKGGARSVGAKLDAVGLRDLLPEPPSPEALARALEDAFADFFGGPPEGSGLDSEERAAARRLAPGYGATSLPTGSSHIDNSEAVW